MTAWEHDVVVHGYWIDHGRILAGEYPGARNDDDTARARLGLLVDAGIRTFVDLTTTADRMTPYEHVLTDIAGERELDLRRIPHPIPDMGTIPDEGYPAIVATIRSATERGGVYLHCWGGIGRTGTVAGCLLVDRGMTGDHALEEVSRLRADTRKAHMCAPQSVEQADVVRRYRRPT